MSTVCLQSFQASGATIRIIKHLIKVNALLAIATSIYQKM